MARKKAWRRKPSEKVRIYGPAERIAWMKRRPCVACRRRGNIHSHHTENGGMGRKAGAETTVPLCGDCHWRWHHYGYLICLDGAGLERALGPDSSRAYLKAAAAATERLWQEHQRSKAAA